MTLVRDRDLARTIRALYGINRARRIQRSLEPQCLSGFRKDESFRILHSDVILVADAGDFVFYDCIYEELLQALGPINDDATVPWSMFNDDVQMGFFDVYDQYILNILYHPRIRPGMTRGGGQGRAAGGAAGGARLGRRGQRAAAVAFVPVELEWPPSIQSIDSVLHGCDGLSRSQSGRPPTVRNRVISGSRKVRQPCLPAVNGR